MLPCSIHFAPSLVDISSISRRRRNYEPQAAKKAGAGRIARKMGFERQKRRAALGRPSFYFVRVWYMLRHKEL